MNFKVIGLAILVIFYNESVAQEKPAFRIISTYGDVTLDGVPVTFDQIVTTASVALQIKEGGYAGILLPLGDLKRVDPGTYQVADLGSKRWWLARTNARHIDPVIFPNTDSKSNSLVGDSLFLRWHDFGEKKQIVKITDIYGDVLLDTLVQGQQIIINVQRFFARQKEIVFTIKAGRMDQNVLIKRISQDQLDKLNLDLKKIQNHPHKKVLTIAILNSHSLLLDTALRTNQWSSEISKDLPLDLKNFMDEMIWSNTSK